MSDRVTEHVLLSALSQQQFLARLEHRSDEFDRDLLTARWRDARDAIARIAEREDGCADDAAILPIPPEMAAHVDAVIASPVIDRAFSRVPVTFGLIELDSTMSSRSVLVEERVAAMASSWGAAPDDAALAAACLPLDGQRVDTSRLRFDGRCLSIIDDTESLEQLEVSVQDGPSTAEIPGPGEVHAVLRVIVGTPPALVHAVRHDGRLLLVDGHHRARALRAAGVTFVPAIVSVCGDLDDVVAVAPRLAELDLEGMFDAPRPPMLRDFGRGVLVHSYPARRPSRLLQWRIEATSQWLP